MATSDSATAPGDKSDMFSDEIKGEVIEWIRTFGFDLKTAKTDLTLLVEDRKIYVNRVVLELLSPTFEKMFSELSLDGEQNEFEIHGHTFKDFVEFLACIYPGKMRRVTMANVFGVVPLARKFNIDFLMEKCESVLIDEMSKADVDESVIVQCGNTAIQYNLLSLRQKSLDDICKRLYKEIDTLDKELPLEDKGRLIVYEKLLPPLRSEASRNRYLSAGLPCKDKVNLEPFTDAKYKKLDIQLDTVKDKTDSYEVAIWNKGCKIEVKKDFRLTHISLTLTIGEDEKCSCLPVAFKVVVKNNDPHCPQGDFCSQNCTVFRNCSFSRSMIVHLPTKDLQDMKYRMNGVYTISVHILMNKPEYS